MSKKSFFGSSKDDETQADQTSRDQTTNDPNLQQADRDAQQGQQPEPTGRLPMDLNKETADEAALVNPHNEAAAQRPANVPIDTGDRVQGIPLNDLDKASADDRQHYLHAWARDVQLYGPKSADWDTFYRILGKEQNAPVQVPRRADERTPRADEVQPAQKADKR